MTQRKNHIYTEVIYDVSTSLAKGPLCVWWLLTIGISHSDAVMADGRSRLRHPDKVRSCDPGEAKAAFARLDAAAKVVEALFELGHLL